jgi:RimJ/RimL family protein N-acetyltransferase
MELINCTKEYWQFVREIRTHPDNIKSFYTQPKITEEQQVDYMAKNWEKYKICIIDNIPVGYIGIINLNEITYCVHPDYKGRGIGTFMVSQIIGNMDKLTAFVIPENIASARVFEKLGFSKQLHYTYIR